MPFLSACVFKHIQSELIFHLARRCEAKTLTDDSVSRSGSGQNDVEYFRKIV